MKKFPSRESGRLTARALKRLQIRRATLLVTLFALLLSTFTFVNQSPVRAATVGSGACVQTVDFSSGVSVAAVGSDCVVTFTRGTRTWTVPAGVTNVDVLVIGGGGGGGGDGGSGGGGGEIRRGTQVSTSNSSVTISIGDGGAGGSWLSGTNGANGSATLISSGLTFRANGGIGGGGWTTTTGGAGGSGGNGGLGTNGQQGGGGPGDCTPSGVLHFGASPAGTTYSDSISGTSGNYGGGGGGGLGAQTDNNGDAELGVAGGGTNNGGRGANYKLAVDGVTSINGASPGQSGFANTGGGGGAGSACNAEGDMAAGRDGVTQRTAGGDGGSGVAVVRYTLATQATLALTSTTAYVGTTLELTTSGGNGTGAVTYAVTSQGATGCSVSGSTLSFTGVGTCTITATKAAADGYTSATSAATAVTISAYTVTYDSKGGTAVSSGSFSVGGSISEPTAPTRSGYTFGGWSAIDGDPAVTWPYSPGVSSNITLYAKWTASQSVDYALNFNGLSSSYADSTTPSIINTNGDSFTVEAWFKAESGAPTNSVIVSQGSETANVFFVRRVSTTGAIEYRYRSQVGSCGTTTLSTWNHIAVVVTGGTGIKCFLNGSEIASGTYSGSTPAIGSGFTVGNTKYDRTAAWKGSIDEVRVYNTARTATQIAADAHAYATIGDASLIAYYDFNEGSGTTGFNQKSGATSATNLTLSGTPTFADVAVTSVSGATTRVTFNRSYLNNTGGWATPANASSAHVLVVGGGGGGGDSKSQDPNRATGGSGGAGGYFENQTVPISGRTPVVVGFGGTGAQATNTQGTTGGDSSFGALKTGGGGGGNSYNLLTATQAQSGNGGSDYVSGGNGGGGRSRQGTNNDSISGGLGGSRASSGVTFNGTTFTGHAGTNGGSGGRDFGSGGLGGQIEQATRTSSISGSSTVYSKQGPFSPWSQQVNNPQTFGSGGSTNYNYGSAETTGNTLGGNGAQGIVIVAWQSGFTVTYEVNGGEAISSDVFTIGGAAITLPTPSRTGYTFDGWYEASDFSGSAIGSSYSPSQSRTIYAKWTATTVTATFKSNYSGGASDTTQSIPFSTATALTTNAFTRTGYTFAGWTTNADGTGTNYTDGQSVTLTSGLTLYAKWVSEIDYALDFDQSIASSSGRVIDSTAFSLEFWLKYDGTRTGTWRTIVNQYQSSSSRIYVAINTSNQLTYAYGGSTTSAIAAAEYSLPTNRWTHVALTRSSTGIPKLYVDGVLVDTQSTANTTLPTAALQVGSRSAEWFGGELDQLKIWGAELTQSEIRASMHSYGETQAIGSAVASGKSLDSHYDFNEGTGSTIFDLIGGANLTTSGGTTTYRDVKTTNVLSSGATVVTFPRTYLPGVGGWTVPDGVSSVRSLVVAGGGGGGSDEGGGGGAGGLIATTTQNVSGVHAVIVGQGGLGGYGTDGTTQNRRATSGQNSQFVDVESIGGGAGGDATSATLNGQSVRIGLSGGSGGGGAGEQVSSAGGSGTAGQGNNGRSTTGSYTGGGGGGAGGAGGLLSSNTSYGGAGLQSNITGTNAYYAAGGSGGRGNSLDGSSPSTNGIGGAGGGDNANATPGAVNTGSGGGGGKYRSSATAGAEGGAGVVIVRYTIGYEITFVSGADATGDDQSVTKTQGEALNLPNSATANGYFTRTGFTITGWSTTDGGSQTHALGSSFTTDATTTFYPVWASTLALTTPTSGLSATVDSSYTLSLATSGGAGTNVFTVASGTLPAGLSLDASTGVISGTPTTTGNQAITITVTDAASSSVTSSSFTISVAAATLSNVGTPTVTATTGTLKSVDVSWTSVANASSYSLKIYASNGSTLLDTITLADNLTSYTITSASGSFESIADGTVYQISLTAVGTGNYATSDESAKASVTTLATYTISYNANEATGGTEPSNQTKIQGTNLTLATNSGTLVRTGYRFDGWNTQANGLGTSYATAGSYSVDASDELFAKWVADVYTVTYNYDNATGGNTTATADFTVGGSALVLPTPTRTGYTFAGWHSDSAKTVLVGNAGASYSPTASLTLYAKWTEITYTITYDRNTETGSPERATDTYTYTGGAVTLATVGSMAKTGFTFDGWQVSGTSTKLSSPYIPSADVTLEARWSAASYTITYFSNSGGTAPNADTYTTGNAALTLPTQGSMARSGYTFNGWSTTINNVSTKIAGSETSATLITSAPVNLFALWTAINYTVTYCEESTCSNSAAFSGSVPVDATVYNIGNSVIVKANSGNIVRTGYSFAGWTIDSDGTGTGLQSGQIYEVQSSNIRFYPKWSANTYTITYNANGATGAPVRATDTYTTGNSATTLAGVGSMAKFGHTFSGWSADPMGSGQTTATTTSDVTLYAIWTVNSIQYTYRLGSVNGSPVNENLMSLVPLPLIANSPFNTSTTLSSRIDSTYTTGGSTYQFFGWRDNINGQTFSSGSSYLIQTESDVEFVAQWVQILEVRYVFNGGTGSAGNTAAEAECTQVGNTCLAGQTITLNTAPTRDGYTFTGWKDQTGADFVAGTSATVSNTSYLFYAQWQAIDYTMTFNSNGGDAVNANQVKNIGQGVTFPSPGSRTGYDFNGWAAQSTTSPTYGTGTSIVTGTTGINFVASWTPRTYTVTYNWNGGVGSPTNPASYTVDGTAITLPTGTNTRDGYVFDGWQVTGTTTKLTSPYAPTANTLLEARWLDGAYVITFDAFNNTVDTSSSVTRATALTLPTPTRTGFSFAGWYQDAGYTLLYGAGGASVTPTASRTLYGKWTQNSLVGINPAHLNSLVELTMVANSVSNWSGSHAQSGTGATLSVPANALPAGTKVNVSFVEDLNRPANLIDVNNAYFTSVAVHWLTGSGETATVPDAVSGSPLSLTLTNPAIVAGAKVFKILNGVVTEVATATVDGQVTITFTQDPEFVVAATRPGSPTAVTATNNQNAQSTITWTAPLGNGGSSVTGYTTTASPGGATCTTAGTSCQITGLTNNTSYTFTVVATNAIGDSLPSSPSSAITPRLAINYNVTFNSNGGTPVGNSSFVENGTLSAPTDPTRNGFNFIGWATVNGDESTIISFPYSPSNADLTLYAIWRASNPALNPDNSGNNGAVITPISTKPSATPKAASTAKPTSSASPAATPVPTPKDLFANAPKPNAGIDTPNQGEVNAIVGDEPIETVITITEFAKQIAIGDSISIAFQAIDAAGNQLPTSPDGSVQVVQGATISASGSGFKASSPVEAWLYSTPVLLGSGLANADGSFDNTYAIDSDFPLGGHTVVLHGISPTDEVITLALGVTVIADESAVESSSNTLLLAILAFLGALLTVGLWLVLRRRSGTHKK